MANAYYATNYLEGDGVTTVWDVAFAGNNPDQGDGTEPYLESQEGGDVRAALLITNEDGTVTEEELEGELISATQFRIVPAVAAGQEFKIYRDTLKQYPLTDFKNFASISAEDLDLSTRQALYVVQELNDVILYSDKRSVAASLNAQEALDSARAAQTDVSLAVDTANDAESIANAASSTAGSALTASSQALNTANSADEKADTAIGTANTALSTANEAETAATNANSSSNAAVSTANSADEKADTAISTANSADEKADTAIATANAAASDAGAAVMTANAAESKADDALAVATDITDFQGQLDDLSDRVDGLVGLDTSDLLLGSNNLSELSNYAAARSNLDVYSTTQVDTAIGQAISNHAGEDDPHPVYALKANLSEAASRPIGDGDTELVTNDRASSLIGDRMSSHESAPDPHPQYLTAEEVGGAAAYDVGSASGELTTNARATAISSSSAANAVSAHEGETNPHPQYLRESELPTATTNTAGIVQLSDSTSSTSSEVAATAAAVNSVASSASQALASHKTGGDHDSRYYRKSEIDDRYYRKSEIDDRYYTKSQVGTVGGVGSYAFLLCHTDNVAPGDLVGGGYLRYSDVSGAPAGSEGLPGTWRCMGVATGTERKTVFFRVS